MKCDGVCAKLPVSVLIGDRWIDGQISDYNLGHTHGKDNWYGHVCVQFDNTDNRLIVKVPASLIGSHLRERKEAA